MAIETSLKRILIVDDEPVVRKLCVRVLQTAGYAVETATDSLQALAHLEKQTFDVVLTDYRMPGELNGLALAKIIKERTPQTHIILMTAFPTVDTAVGTLRMGAYGYLIKPFDPTELTENVKTCVEKSLAA